MLTHINEQGRAKMVDVSEKKETIRVARALAKVLMKESTLKRIKEGGIKKGDVLSVAQVAGIMAAKNTANSIPMCHPIMLSAVNINYQYLENGIKIIAEVKCAGKTGVEMEALTAVSITGLTIYDMCKAIDKEMIITDICLLEKSGGKSGHFRRKQSER